MSKSNNEKIGLTSVFDKIKEKYNEFDTTKRSQSQDILINYTKVYKKTKIIIKRPQIIDNKNIKAKSVSKKKSKKYLSLTYNIKNKNNKILNYNYFNTSAKNKNIKFENNNIRIINNFDEFENNKFNNELDSQKKTLFLIKIMDRLYSKYLKEKYTNKMKSILNFYSQKQNMNNIIISMMIIIPFYWTK